MTNNSTYDRAVAIAEAIIKEDLEKKRIQNRYKELFAALLVNQTQTALAKEIGIVAPQVSKLAGGAKRSDTEIPIKMVDAKIVGYLRKNYDSNWSMQNLVTFLESDLSFEDFKPQEKNYIRTDVKALCDQLSFDERMNFVNRFFGLVGSLISGKPISKTTVNSNQSLEIWKPINGYEGIYEVSNHGRVRSLDRDIKNGSRIIRFKGVILKTALYGRGYLCVVLSKDAVPKTKLVHDLVASAFVSNPHDYKFVIHDDGDITNNNASNLRFAAKK